MTSRYANAVVEGSRIALGAKLMVEISRRGWTHELGKDAWAQAGYCLDAPGVIPAGSYVASPDDPAFDQDLGPMIEPSFTFRP